MNYLFFGFLALCIFICALVGMFLAFCYKQEDLAASMRNKTVVRKDEFSSETIVDINKDHKKETSK